MSATFYDAPGFKQLIEERWVAVALLYGPPLPHFAMYHDWTMPLAFRMALEQVFDPEEVKRVGMRRMAFDYYEWYIINEHTTENRAADAARTDSQSKQIRT